MVVLAAVLGAAALIDGATGRIPNRLLAAGTAAILALRLAADAPVGPALGAGAGVTVVLAVVRAGSIWWTGRPGLGMGDVKLGLVMGLALGWGALWALYLAAVVGAAVGTAGLASGRWTRSSPLPFAPFIAAGTAASALLPYSAALHLVSGI
jgi:leader peptidase (prepilin peptidase)/N-methyltransferase